jgi:hypothetical protein
VEENKKNENVNGVTPFNVTEAEYEGFLKKQQAYANERFDSRNIFEIMNDDLDQFAGTDNEKILLKALSEI